MLGRIIRLSDTATGIPQGSPMSLIFYLIYNTLLISEASGHLHKLYGLDVRG